MAKNKTKNTTWDLSLLYKNDNDPQIKLDIARYKKNSYRFIDKWKDRTDYLTNTEVLKEALDDYNTWLTNGGVLGDIGYYFSLKQALDENDPKLKAEMNKLNDLGTKIENDSQFFTLRLAKVKKTKQSKFLQAKILAPYQRWLKRVFDDAKYLLSEPEEKIMNLKSAPAHSQWVNMLSSLLAKETRLVYNRSGKLENLPLSEITSLTANRQKKIRDKAVIAFNDILNRQVDVAEAEINAILLNKKINDELRGLPRPDTSRHLSDDIDTKVVDTLLKEVTKAYTLSQKYYALKAKLFKQDKLLYHERNVPYGVLTKEYSFSDSVKLVGEVLRNLDPDFDRYFQKFITNRQIDVYPKQGKSGGAFCAHNLKTSPTYILLNHTNELMDVLTLAHEVGHGLNNELMKETQSELYFGTPMVTAEVASTFVEDFVLQRLLVEADDKLKLSLMMFKLNDEVSTIIRQVAAYRFEQELHQTFRQKGYVAKEEIGQIFTHHMSAYMGEAVIQSPGSANWWVHWSHFRSFFYVYSYASGLLISKSLQAKVKADPKFISQVKEFLRTGEAKTPAVIFKDLGIDIADPKFFRRGLKEIEVLLQETENLAKKLKKI